MPPRTLSMIDCRKLPLRSAPSANSAKPGGLVEAQVPAAVERLDVATYASWGRGLTIEQYLCRERVLRATPFSQRGLRTWTLRDGDTVLASCESYDVATKTAREKKGHSVAIASVYVEAAHRGHGYASELLTLLHDAVRKEGALASYLMTEIGPSLYQRLGYVPRPLSLRRYAAAEAGESHGSTPPWIFLTAPEVPQALAARKLPPRALTVEVEAEHVQWHMTRSVYFAAVLAKKTTPHVGAIARGGDAMILWAPEYRESPEGGGGVLRVLTLYPGAALAAVGASFDPRSEAAAELRNVLHAARAVATELGLSGIEIWENLSNTAYLRGGVRTEHPDVPMLLGLKEGIRAEDWLDYERAHWI